MQPGPPCRTRLAALVAATALGAALGCNGKDDPDSADAAVADAALHDTAVALDGGPRAPSADFAVSGCLAVVPLTSDAGVGGRCEARAPATLTFVSLDELSASTFVWSFGDQSPPSSERAPTHVYRLPGDYTVSLIVGGAGGTDSVMREGFVAVRPAPLGARCQASQQCSPSLDCRCVDDPACPLALREGLCTRACTGDADCGSGALCADLRVPGLTSPSPAQQRLCVPSCTLDDDCPRGLPCRELPRADAGASERLWARGCFASAPREVGAACAGSSGALEPAGCLGGGCAAIGARGACTRRCASDLECPTYASCMALSRATSEGFCLARCAGDRPCDSDPYLACSAPDPSGDLGLVTMPSSAPAPAAPLCAPRRCTGAAECGVGGACIAAGGASFCTAQP